MVDGPFAATVVVVVEEDLLGSFAGDAKVGTAVRRDSSFAEGSPGDIAAMGYPSFGLGAYRQVAFIPAASYFEDCPLVPYADSSSCTTRPSDSTDAFTSKPC